MIRLERLSSLTSLAVITSLGLISLFVLHSDNLTSNHVALEFNPTPGLAPQLFSNLAINPEKFLNSIGLLFFGSIFPLIKSLTGKRNQPSPGEIMRTQARDLTSLRSILDSLDTGIVFQTGGKKVDYVNRAFCKLFSMDMNITMLQSLEDILQSIEEQCKNEVCLKTQENGKKHEVTLNNGKIITHLGLPVYDHDDKELGQLRLFADVTQERTTSRQLFYLAEHDFLTGLFNRRHFQDELSRVLDLVSRQRETGALLFFDLDEFKYVNDTFGHRAGDTMLIRVASEVSKLIVGPKVLGRLGGDEFAVLIPGATRKDAEELGQQIVQCISHIPFICEGQAIRLTTSVGIALYPNDGADLETLISRSDAALYQAKAAGKNIWRVYNESLDTSREMLHSMSWNERIINAIENDLLRLHFQGVYDTNTRALAHAEALIRMIDQEMPNRFIMPSQFIPIAEKTGRIVDIDRWVIRESVRTLSKHPKLSALAINISGRTFDDSWLADYISECLREYNVSPRRLMVELTETAAITDLNDAHNFIDALQQIGCRVCLDDFGAGFSSFTYLKHLKADVLKIDGQFIKDLPSDRDNQIFVKAIVDVARGMHKKTVAEFVEDRETLAMLKEFGVDMAQGYHLDIPRSTPPVSV